MSDFESMQLDKMIRDNAIAFKDMERKTNRRLMKLELAVREIMNHQIEIIKSMEELSHAIIMSRKKLDEIW